MSHVRDREKTGFWKDQKSSSQDVREKAEKKGGEAQEDCSEVAKLEESRENRS